MNVKEVLLLRNNNNNSKPVQFCQHESYMLLFIHSCIAVDVVSVRESNGASLSGNLCL